MTIGQSKQVKRLRKVRERAIEQIGRLRQELRVEIEPGIDDDSAADIAGDVYERGKVLSQIQILEDKLRAVDHAISLASRGMYGVCEACGNPIPEERLEIVPETTLCVACAGKREQGIGSRTKYRGGI